MSLVSRLFPGVAILAITWLGPLPDLARDSFAAHMTMHMAVVAVAAPLLSIAIAGTALDPTRAVPLLFAAIPASITELVVVWAWHAPALHHAAREQTWVLVLEQASFLSAGFFLWIACCGGPATPKLGRSAASEGGRGAGVVALLFTSMHMTLLGALFAVANRPLFAHATASPALLADQQLGGTIMLLVGGTSYLAGGLWLLAGMLKDRVSFEASP